MNTFEYSMIIPYRISGKKNLCKIITKGIENVKMMKISKGKKNATSNILLSTFRGLNDFQRIQSEKVFFSIFLFSFK